VTAFETTISKISEEQPLQRALTLGVTALALVTTACGHIYDYPDPRAENTLEACSDGADNDLDGKTDCNDAECTFCAEDDVTACNDGLDNDGDGFKDAGDPSCWPDRVPEVERCASGEGVSVVENFDAGLQAHSATSPWVIGGQYSLPLGGLADIVSSFGQVSWPVGFRQDNRAFFNGNTGQGFPSPSSLGALVRRSAFSGSWQGFELSFLTYPVEGTVLRVAIVPVELAPLGEPPRRGAETALLGLALDATRTPPLLSLDVEGRNYSAPIPMCGTDPVCDVADSTIRIILEEQGFLATWSWPSGETVELRADPPSSLSLAPARLVFWGGSETPLAQGGIELNDVRLRIAPERPCGRAQPEITAFDCGLSDAQRAFGQVVSLASNGAGERCALIASSPSASTLEPDSVSAWSSVQGSPWTQVSPPETGAVALPAATTLVGASIVHVDDLWQVAVAHRTGETVDVGIGTSSTCSQWGALTAGPTLAGDAEAPSYVITGSDEQLYFTRAPSEDHGHRSLWRSTRRGRESQWSNPEQVASLPDHVGSPVAIQLVGSRDLVMVHPTPLSEGVASLGLMVGGLDAHSWRSVEPSPFLTIPGQSDPGAFDDHGVLSGALSWDGDSGFLLYGGVAAPAPNGLGGFSPGNLAVGTARLAARSASFAAPIAEPIAVCGDGRCDDLEDCSSCADDCACSGTTLLFNAFDDDAAWRVLSSSLAPTAMAYIDTEQRSLNFGGGTSTWATLPLGHSLAGDFELSFDLLVDSLDPNGESCSVYVGLGDLVENEAGGSEPRAGAFARFAYSRYCAGGFVAMPFVQASAVVQSRPEEHLNDAYAACKTGERYFSTGIQRRFSLRREGNRVSVSTSHGQGCGDTTESIDYAGALEDLSELMLGWGGGAFGECVFGTGAGSVSNLRLRLLHDSGDCPEGTIGCATDGPGQSCVDTARSPEHCGSCGAACSANQICRDGVCMCAPSPTMLSCEAGCVDSRSSDHCGACDSACSEACVAGTCENGLIGTCAFPISLVVDYWTPDETDAVALVDLPIEFSERSAEGTELCDTTVSHHTVVNWQPTSSGLATIELDATGTPLDPVLGVSTDPGCSSFLTCNDDAPTLGKGSRVDLQVAAGTIYRISAGLRAGDPLSGPVMLRIKTQAGDIGGLPRPKNPDPVSPDEIVWLRLERDEAPSGLAPNGELGLNGVFLASWDSCAEASWDPETRCLRGTLCDPGPEWENYGADVNFAFRRTEVEEVPSNSIMTWNPAAAAVRGLAWETSGTENVYGVYVLNMDPAWGGVCPSWPCTVFGPADGTFDGPGTLEWEPTAPNGHLLFNSMVKEDWGGIGINYAFDYRQVVSVQFKIFPEAGPFEFCVDRLGAIR
jgi:hypothetical protein